MNHHGSRPLLHRIGLVVWLSSAPLLSGCLASSEAVRGDDIASSDNEALAPSSGGSGQAYVATSAVWDDPTIPVCWENPSEANTADRDLVRSAVANTWEAVSRVRFTGWDTCEASSSGIRIRIADGQPQVRTLGKGLDGLGNGMRLNFTFNDWSPRCAQIDKPVDLPGLDTDEPWHHFCVRAIAVHEFGHALSFAHEQNRLDTPQDPSLCSDAPAGANGDLPIGAWDAFSVMNYCNKEWNGYGQLSPTDIEAVQQLYGAPSSSETRIDAGHADPGALRTLGRRWM